MTIYYVVPKSTYTTRFGKLELPHCYVGGYVDVCVFQLDVKRTVLLTCRVVGRPVDGAFLREGHHNFIFYETITGNNLLLLPIIYLVSTTRDMESPIGENTHKNNKLICIAICCVLLLCQVTSLRGFH